MALDEVRLELEASKRKLAVVDELQEKVAMLKKSLKQQTEKHETLIEEKDTEIASLRAQSGIPRASNVDATSSNDVSENTEISSYSWALRQGIPCRFIHW